MTLPEHVNALRGAANLSSRATRRRRHPEPFDWLRSLRFNAGGERTAEPAWI
jgi:hypothetical protein